MSEAKGVKADGRQSGIGGRSSIVITRTGKSRSGPSMGSMRGSMSLTPSMSPGTIQQLSNSGVSEFKGTRQKEKRDLQELNERLAGYIDKVHFLEAQCKKLEAENEALRNRKTQDLEPIRRAYENELSQARNVIDDLATSKGQNEAKMVGLQDEIDSLRELIATYESQAKDYQKKIESLGNQVGDYEGELHTLRLRVSSLEDENAKVRDLLAKVQDQNKRLRADLDTETAAHIEADCLAQTKTEEAEFYKDLLDEFELLKPEPIQIKGMDYGEFWKSEMQKALRDINSVYDEKVGMIQADCEAKYSSQINSLHRGNVKDGMQLQKAQEEAKRLKGQLSEKNSAYAELATKLAAMQAERDELARQLSEMERELESQRLKYNQDVGDLQEELTSVLAQLQTLMDAKMSLELEIACYKKLLEGEESRVGLRSLVEQALDTQTKGSAAASLADALQQQSNTRKKGGQVDEDEPSGLKESTGSLTVQRSSKGPIAFKSMDHSGGNIVIENGSSGARARTQRLKGWRVVKTVNNRNTVDVPLIDYELGPGKTFVLYAKGAKSSTSADNEQIADAFSFGVGTCIWKLLDESGNEKATLKANFIN